MTSGGTNPPSPLAAPTRPGERRYVARQLPGYDSRSGVGARPGLDHYPIGEYVVVQLAKIRAGFDL